MGIITLLSYKVAYRFRSCYFKVNQKLFIWLINILLSIESYPKLARLLKEVHKQALICHSFWRSVVLKYKRTIHTALLGVGLFYSTAQAQASVLHELTSVLGRL